MKTLKQNNPSFDLSGEITIRTESKEKPLVGIYGHTIVKKGTPEKHYYTTYSPSTGDFSEEEKTTIGETLYRLHFFDQIPIIGRYLSGFVALFFAFAVVTGVMIHWKNILTKFYGFSLKGSMKNIWTNAHTVFGLLGLPFQLMYAITGAYYMLSFLVLLPVVVVFFDGDQEKAFKVILAERFMDTTENSPLTLTNFKVTSILARVKKEHPDLELHYLQIKHFDREDGIMTAALENSRTFAGDGSITISLRNGSVLADNLPGKKTYAQSVLFGIARLHFAKFGGLMLKAIYFFLALFSCFVIISGVLLWKEARNKKSYTEKQKQFHHRVTMVYLAICFGLFPATAVLFVAELAVPAVQNHVFYVRSAFFTSWLLFTTAGLFSKTEVRVTYLYLLTGGFVSIAVPLANAITTGDWIWVSWKNRHYFVAGTDVFWLTTGVVSLTLAWFASMKESKTHKASSSSKSNAMDISVTVSSEKS